MTTLERLEEIKKIESKLNELIEIQFNYFGSKKTEKFNEYRKKYNV